MRKLATLLIMLSLILGTALAEPVKIAFSDGGIQCDDANVIVDGSVVTIPAPGEYELTGETSDAQVIVDCDYEGDLTLILNNLSLHSERGAAIYVKQCTTKLIVRLADGSVNTLSDGAAYEFDKEDEPNAVLFSRDDMIIDGGGSLNINAQYMDGIVCKDDLLIKSGVFSISAARNGIRGKDSVEILDGSFDIVAGNDGIKSTNEKDFTKGYVTVSGGDIRITCADDPISATTKLCVLGGTINAKLIPEGED